MNEQEIEAEVNRRTTLYKEEFINDISHELRTPITSIKVAVHMLKLDCSQDKRKVYLSIIELEAERQIKYINKLLKEKKI